MLADGSEEELVGLEQAAVLDDILLCFGLRGRWLQILCVFLVD